MQGIQRCASTQLCESMDLYGLAVTIPKVSLSFCCLLRSLVPPPPPYRNPTASLMKFAKTLAASIVAAEQSDGSV